MSGSAANNAPVRLGAACRGAASKPFERLAAAFPKLAELFQISSKNRIGLGAGLQAFQIFFKFISSMRGQ